MAYDYSESLNKPSIDSVTQIAEILEPTKVVNNNSVQIVQNVVAASDKQELQKQFELFHINQGKKNALRIMKLEKFRDKIEDEAIIRFEKRPDQIGNKELRELMEAVSNEIDRSQKAVNVIQPPEGSIVNTGNTDISNTNTTNGDNYNINLGTELSRDNKENVVDAIKSIIGMLQTNTAQDLIDKNLNPEDSENTTIEVVEENDTE